MFKKTQKLFDRIFYLRTVVGKASCSVKNAKEEPLDEPFGLNGSLWEGGAL